MPAKVRLVKAMVFPVVMYLDKNPMPGHLSELQPVNEVNTKGQFFCASLGKNPRFQIQLDMRPKLRSLKKSFISLQARSITFYVIFLCFLKNRKWAAIKSIQQSIQEPRWLQSNTTFLHLVQLLKNTE